jgi:hypothetical protein
MDTVDEDVERVELLFEHRLDTGKTDIVVKYISPPYWTYAEHTRFHDRKVEEVKEQLRQMGFPEEFVGKLVFLHVDEEGVEEKVIEREIIPETVQERPLVVEEGVTH